MKIIYNKHIPFKGFAAMAVCPLIFVRGTSISAKSMNHEMIHFEQQKELWFIGFYLLYLYFWATKGYKKIPFEREAKSNEYDFTYLRNRKKFAWI